MRERKTLWPRIATIISTPGHARAVFVRRTIAAGLVVAALCVALISATENPEVPVFARDVAAGQPLREADIAFKRLPRETIPAAALETPLTSVDLLGRVSASMAAAGEVITESRLVGPHLTEQLVRSSTQVPGNVASHMVPLKLAEPDIIPLLHHGDTVTVIAAAEENHRKQSFPTPEGALTPDPPSPTEHTRGATGESPNIPEQTHTIAIAAGAKVISTVQDDTSRQGSKASTILIALPEDQAQDVAAASLRLPLTVVITGPRADAHRLTRELGSIAP